MLRPIPPMVAWAAPRTTPPTRPPTTAEPASSMPPTAARAATPASGKPTNVPTQRPHRCNLDLLVVMAPPPVVIDPCREMVRRGDDAPLTLGRGWCQRAV